MLNSLSFYWLVFVEKESMPHLCDFFQGFSYASVAVIRSAPKQTLVYIAGTSDQILPAIGCLDATLLKLVDQTSELAQ